MDEEIVLARNLKIGDEIISAGHIRPYKWKIVDFIVAEQQFKALYTVHPDGIWVSKDYIMIYRSSHEFLRLNNFTHTEPLIQQIELRSFNRLKFL